MTFNCDPTKQAQEVILFRQTIKANHPLLFFNGKRVVQTGIQEHLGIFLDTKLSFPNLLKTAFEKKIKQKDFFVNCD